MQVQKAIKVQIYPQSSDHELLARHFGARRFIYNYMLNLKKKEWEENKRSISFFDSCKLITEMKKKPEFAWMKEVDTYCFRHALKDLDTAYTRFFRKISKFPKFKSKHGTRQSFRVMQNIKIDEENKTIKIPKFKNPFKFRGSIYNKLIEFNSVTISKNASGKYFASIQGIFEIEQKESTGEIIGIDLGLKSLLVDSNGTEIKNERFLKKHLKRLKFLHRFHSRKKKGSNSRNKARRRPAIQYQRVTFARNNYLHSVSSKLINENQVICIEDLAVKNMIQNHCLAQAISDVSWGTLVSYLKYKADWHGRQIIKIDRFFPSSKTCSHCGHKIEKMDLSIREWDCPECNTHHDRDVNAAKNVLQQGLKIMSGLGDKSDFCSAGVEPRKGRKQKRVEALTLVGSMKLEEQRCQSCH